MTSVTLGGRKTVVAYASHSMTHVTSQGLGHRPTLLKFTMFETVDEIAYAALTGGVFNFISLVMLVSKLKNGCNSQ